MSVVSIWGPSSSTFFWFQENGWNQYSFPWGSHPKPWRTTQKLKRWADVGRNFVRAQFAGPRAFWRVKGRDTELGKRSETKPPYWLKLRLKKMTRENRSNGQKNSTGSSGLLQQQLKNYFVNRGIMHLWLQKSMSELPAEEIRLKKYCLFRCIGVTVILAV